MLCITRTLFYKPRKSPFAADIYIGALNCLSRNKLRFDLYLTYHTYNRTWLNYQIEQRRTNDAKMHNENIS